MNQQNKSSEQTTKRNNIRLAFPLIPLNPSKNEMECDNGEIDLRAGFGAGSDGDSPSPEDFNMIENGDNSVRGDTPEIKAVVEFALGRYAPVPETANEVFPPYNFRMTCAYDPTDLFLGNDDRTDAHAAAEILKSFSAMAFPVVENIRKSAAQRNLLRGSAWIAAAWRLRSGEYCCAGPPVLLVADEGYVQLSITSIGVVDKGYAVAGRVIERYCKILCRLTHISQLPDEVVGCDLFMSPVNDDNCDSAIGEFGTIDTSGNSFSGKLDNDGNISEIAPTPVQTTSSRTRSWRPKVYADRKTVAVPAGMRLIARIDRARFSGFSRFSEPDYEPLALQAILKKQTPSTTLMKADYQSLHPLTNARSAYVAMRQILFDFRKEYFRGYTQQQMSSFRSSSSDEVLADRIFVGIRQGNKDVYIPLERNIILRTSSPYPLGTSCFYPSDNAFEFVVENDRTRYRFPLRGVPELKCAVWSSFEPFTTEVISQPLGGEIAASRKIDEDFSEHIRVSSAGLTTYFPSHLEFTINGTGKITGIGEFGNLINTFFILSHNGLRRFRMNADGSVTLLTNVSDIDCTGVWASVGKYTLFLTDSGLVIHDGYKIISTSGANILTTDKSLNVAILSRLPGATQLINKFCAFDGTDTGEGSVRFAIEKRSGSLIVINPNGDCYASTLPDGDWTYRGNLNGEDSTGYLLTRPIRFDKYCHSGRIDCLEAMMAPSLNDCVTALYCSHDGRLWTGVTAGNGTVIHPDGGIYAPFWRILFISKKIPAGFLITGKILKR